MTRVLWLLALAGAGAAIVLTVGPSVSSRNVAQAFDPTTAPEIQDRLLDGYAALEFGLGGSNQSSSNEHPPNAYYPRGSNACSQNIASNIKVNQNCQNVSDPDLQGRSQAQNETSIAVNPFNSNELLAAANDYRLGDGGCFPSYSLDGGRTWNDTVVPWEFNRGSAFGGYPRIYWQSCGDPFVIGYDTKGNAYFGGLQFNRGHSASNNPDQSSAIYVWRSTGNDGASWNFPGRAITTDYDLSGQTLQDKPYGTIDNNANACPASVTAVQQGANCTPFQNRIYVTWTDFAADGSAYIWESYSSDYGEHFSDRHLVSVTSTLCQNTYGLATANGTCNENQFSNPFVGPDGTLYVVYNNYNNALSSASDNENQMLLSYSLDGGNTFLGPVKVGSYYDLPDCATYQAGRDLGRACVPEKGSTANSIFRATNYPVGSVNPTNPNQVVVTYGSYINRHSNESNGCVPASFSPVTGQNLYSGVKTPGACNNDILISVSNDHGLTFTGTTTDPREMPVVTQDPGQATTDQFWQWQAFTKNGKLAVSYYDRQYGTDETTGFSDFSLSGSGDLVSFNTQRVTSSSNPPPTQFSGLFMGDYTGLAAYNSANPLWTDTRNPEVFLCPGSETSSSGPQVCTASTQGAPASPLNDQDIYTANLPVPSK